MSYCLNCYRQTVVVELFDGPWEQLDCDEAGEIEDRYKNVTDCRIVYIRMLNPLDKTIYRYSFTVWCTYYLGPVYTAL